MLNHPTSMAPSWALQHHGAASIPYLVPWRTGSPPRSDLQQRSPLGAPRDQTDSTDVHRTARARAKIEGDGTPVVSGLRRRQETVDSFFPTAAVALRSPTSGAPHTTAQLVHQKPGEGFVNSDNPSQAVPNHTRVDFTEVLKEISYIFNLPWA